MNRTPIYPAVPPGHAKNLRKRCHEYDACGEQVYFVQVSWYTVTISRVTGNSTVTARMVAVANKGMNSVKTQGTAATTTTAMIAKPLA